MEHILDCLQCWHPCFLIVGATNERNVPLPLKYTVLIESRATYVMQLHLQDWYHDPHLRQRAVCSGCRYPPWMYTQNNLIAGFFFLLQETTSKQIGTENSSNEKNRARIHIYSLISCCKFQFKLILNPAYLRTVTSQMHACFSIRMLLILYERTFETLLSTSIWGIKF